MTLKIHHKTRYTYSEKVYVEPHHLYFYPSQRNYFNARSFEIALIPEPSGLSFRIDAENNAYYQAWYNYQIKSMEIDVHMEVQTFEVNPFNFLEEESSLRDHKTALSLFETKEAIPGKMMDWINNIRGLSGNNTITFLTYVNKEIHANWKHNERYAENVLDPDVCFSNKMGSCRDLAWMMIQMLRNFGIPARFVSGYTFNPELEEGHELHAWVEAWINGAGWIGLDPSAGILATDQYIPISSSYKPANTLPVQGSFRGEATSELEFEIRIESIGN